MSDSEEQPEELANRSFSPTNSDQESDVEVLSPRAIISSARQSDVEVLSPRAIISSARQSDVEVLSPRAITSSKQEFEHMADDELPEIDDRVGTSFTVVAKTKETECPADNHEGKLVFTAEQFRELTTTNGFNILPNEVLHDPSSSSIITTQIINDVVSADEIFRGRNGKMVGWPLLDGDIIYAMSLQYKGQKFSTHMPFSISEYESAACVNPTTALTNLHKACPLLDEILTLGEGHLIVAGGAVTAAWIHGNSADVDLFFIGFNAGEEHRVQELLHMLVRYLEDKCADSYPNNAVLASKFIISRSQNTLTVGYPFTDAANNYTFIKLQFIMRMYPDTGCLETNVSLVIGGFDLYCCAAAYYFNPQNGKFKLVATPAGAFSLATRINILVTSRASTSYSHRLIKYMQRGFKVLFTGASQEIMMQKSVEGRLAYRREINSYPIILPHFRYIYHQNMAEFRHNMAQANDYGLDVLDSDPLGLKLSNLSLLLSGKYDQYCIVGSSWSSVFDQASSSFLRQKTNLAGVKENKGPSPTELEQRRVLAIENFITKRWDDLLNNHSNLANGDIRLQQPLVNAFKHSCRTLIGAQLKMWIETYDQQCKNLWAAILLLPEPSQERSALQKQYEKIVYQKLEAKLDDFVVAQPDDFASHIETYLPELISSVLKADADCLAKLHRNFSINSTNPTTQHTSSFNPTIVNPREWWGPENYVPFEVGFPHEIYIQLRLLFTKGAASFLGPGVFKTLLLPYFLRAWAEDKVASMVYSATSNYRNNCQVKYIERLAKAVKYFHGNNFDNIRGSIEHAEEGVYKAMDVGANQIQRIVILPGQKPKENKLPKLPKRPVRRRLVFDE